MQGTPGTPRHLEDQVRALEDFAGVLRVQLSEALKTHAAIGDAVSFVGLGHKFQIWEPGRFRSELAEATAKVRAFRQELGARMTAADQPLGAREE